MSTEPRDQPVPGDPQNASNEQRVIPRTQARRDGPSAARPVGSSDDSESLHPDPRSLTADHSRLRGGELNASITSALVGIHTQYLGRGPRRASTFHYGHALVTLMHDVPTPAEKSLTRTNQTEAVDHIRHLFQEAMEADFREAVERLTGRKVLAFIGGNHIEPDIAAELFILDAPL